MLALPVNVLQGLSRSKARPSDVRPFWRRFRALRRREHQAFAVPKTRWAGAVHPSLSGTCEGRKSVDQDS